MPMSVQIYCPTDQGFPATLSSNGHYFNDTHGNPWLMVGDTAFGLLCQITTQAQIDLYLTTRASQGFNCVYLNYIFGLYDYQPGVGGVTGPYARSDWATPDLITPFLKTGGASFVIGTDHVTDYDISQLNPAYLARLDYIIDKAASLGIYILINPADAAVVDQPDNSGFIAGQGTTKCTAYGVALGNRYKNRQNVGWQFGNDYGLSLQSWSLDSYLGAISDGIRSVASTQLQSIELNFNTSTSYDNPAWGPGRTHKLDIDAVYDYEVVYDHVYKAYAGKASIGHEWTAIPAGAATGYATTPVYFVEGVYERPLFLIYSDDGNPRTPRAIAYYTLCCGGIGGLYGNGCVFPFQEVGYNTTPDPSNANSWQQAILDLGAVQVGKIGPLFRAYNWHNLVPDGSTPNLVTTQTGVGYVSNANSVTQSLNANSWAAGAVTPAGDFGVVYIPKAVEPGPVTKTVTVNMAKMNHSGTVTARWWDPTTFTYTAIGTYSSSGTQTFTPSATAHADGTNDWLLVLTA